MQPLQTGFLLAFTILSLTACGPADEVDSKSPRSVETTTVRVEPWSETISSTGEIIARVQSELSFRISGQIIERLVDVGDHVEAGQLLARIDSQEQEADHAVALATLHSAEAQQSQAQQALTRQESLFKSGVSTRAALDAAREQVLSANATVESAQAQVDTARDTLNQTELRADAAGVITTRNAEVGEVAQAAQLVFTLAQDGPRDAVFNVDESFLLSRNFDDRVQISPLTGGEPIEATLREVSPAIDTRTGTIRVKFGIDADTPLSLGSPVVATAHYKPIDAIRLPWEAMTSDAGRTAVWVVDQQTGKVSLRPVEVLAYVKGYFYVRSGVEPGEIVVTDGTKFLSAGEAVAFQGAGQ